MGKQVEQDILWDDKQLRFHPSNVFLSFLLAGLTVLFIALSVAYIYSRVQNGLPPIRIPWLFYSNTLILIGSSWMLHRAKKAYLSDDTSTYQRSLLFTVVLSLVFLVAQGLAWKTLYDDNIGIASSNAAGYVYAISILHFIHVVGGIPFLCVFLVRAYQRLKEPVSVLIYFSDPLKRLGLRLLTLYWHFLDILWIYLVLFFGINYLIR